MVELIVRGKEIYDKFTKDEMTVYAAQASFFIMIAAFPFLMVLLTGVQVVPRISQGELLEFVMELVPVAYRSMVFRVMNDLSLKSPATMISVSAAAALWSSSRGMMSIARGLNRVHGSERKRWYIVKRLIFMSYTLVFLFSCVLALVLLVFGYLIQAFLVRLVPLAGDLVQGVISIRTILTLAVFLLVFDGIYALVPDTKLPLTSQLPGALFTTLGWIAFSWVFSLYFRLFAGQNFSYMYGSLTAIVLAMLWLYGCICVLFFGAEINWYWGRKGA